MKEYILCRWEKKNKKRRGKRRGEAYMVTLGKIYHNFQDGSVSRTNNFVSEDRTKT